MNPCSIDGCGRPVRARGWCTAHWKRWQRYGAPTSGGPECTKRDPVALLEDLTWLADHGVGATEAARRTDMHSAKNLDKWLRRRGHHDLATRLHRSDPLPLGTSQKDWAA